jgi:hypothetical protein
MVEMHKIMLGTLFTVIVVLGVVLFYTDGILMYSPTGSNNVSVLNSSMSQQFIKINNITNNTKVKLETLANPKSDFFDKVNAFFGAGLDALKVATGTFDVLNDMISTSADQLGVGGSFIRIIRIWIPVILIIIIFIAVFLRAVLKWEI